MKTTIINHRQGSEAWHQHRAHSLNASELAAVMGISAYISRSDLIKQKVTGIIPEIDAQTQRRFDAGHEFEEIARQWAEEIIGSDLYPVVLAGEVDGLSLSSSLDGLTMAADISWEHKTGRADLLASLDQNVIPDEYHPQMEMGLMLSGAEKCLFMASSGDKDAMRWAWYLPNLELRAKIIPTWSQFAIDLESYVPPEVVTQAVGRNPDSLPALHIEVTGMVTASNLAEYKAHALTVFAGINRELVTDDQFADAEKTIKWAGEIESRLAAAKQHALSQTASIDDLFRTIDDISAEARRVRLELDRLVKARKEQVRTEIVMNGASAMTAHLAALNARLGKPYMPSVPADFAGAIKGKKSLDSMRDAVDTTLANAKIAANAIADGIQVNLNTLNELAKAYPLLFPDTAQLVGKANDDLVTLVEYRIASHKVAEAAKEEATRTRIQAEEQAKAETAAREKLAAEQEAAAKELADKLASAHAFAAALAAKDAAPVPELTLATAPPCHQTVAPAITHEVVAAIMMPPAVRQTMVPKVDTPPSLRIGEIANRLGFGITAAFLRTLGFEPAGKEGASVLFHEQDFPGICEALKAHISEVQEQFETVAA